MMRRLALLFAILNLGVALSCTPGPDPSRPARISVRGAAVQPQVSFADRTLEIIGRAEWLIEKNAREAAVMNQEWYAVKRIGKHQELLLRAERIFFYGGLEADVRAHVSHRYVSMTRLDAAADDAGEVRFFAGRSPEGTFDYIAVGQNGREVALKTIIRLLYAAKFADDDVKRRHAARLRSFSRRIKVFLSDASPRTEYLAFFDRNGIRNPDAVVIGFMGDASRVLQDMGFPRPETFSDESLRTLWYPDLNGKKVLLVSINGNRIFASRCGDLMRALFERSAASRPVVTFLGSAGAVDQRDWVGKLVAPAAVMNADPLPAQTRRAPIHLLRNLAAGLVDRQSLHASVESVVVETVQWANQVKNRRVTTVDQELYHLIEAVHESPRGSGTDVYAAVLVTDNVATVLSSPTETLQAAEDSIAATTKLRRDFFLSVFRAQGILAEEKARGSGPQSNKTGTDDP
jgi:hypothetical protein